MRVRLRRFYSGICPFFRLSYSSERVLQPPAIVLYLQSILEYRSSFPGVKEDLAIFTIPRANCSGSSYMLATALTCNRTSLRLYFTHDSRFALSVPLYDQ